MREFLTEYWQFVRTHKKYWLLPMLLVLAALAGFLAFAQGTAIAPFIYTLF